MKKEKGQKKRVLSVILIVVSIIIALVVLLFIIWPIIQKNRVNNYCTKTYGNNFKAVKGCEPNPIGNMPECGFWRCVDSKGNEHYIPR